MRISLVLIVLLIEILGVLLAHDRALTQRAYRAAVIAARLGKSLEFISIQSKNSSSSLQVMIDVWKHCLTMVWIQISWIDHGQRHCILRMLIREEF